MAKAAARPRRAEPAARPDAAAAMSAQLRPDAAPPMGPGVAPGPFRPGTTAPGEAAFDAWLRRELGRLYDAALAEPVPPELARLLERAPPKGGTKKA